MNEMDKGYVDGSRNCAGATNLRAGARVRSHLGLSKWHRDSVPYHHMSCLSLSLRSVSAQGRYTRCVPVSAQGQCACPFPVISFCQCTGTVHVLCPCQCTGTVRVPCPCHFVLSVHMDSTFAVCPCQFVLSVLHSHSFMHHRHSTVLPIESAINL